MTVQSGFAPFNGLYSNTETKEIYKLLGFKNKTVVLRHATTDELLEISYKEFEADYDDTGIHDHEASCCPAHNTHTIPHMGCILR